MYNHQLDTFLEVAKAGSFSAAAGKLYISSSAVSQQISSLEHDLKVSLFIRGKKGVTLTEAGQYLLVQAEEIVSENAILRRKLIEIATRNSFICIGTSMFEKCRLLYELWVLFSMETKAYDIRMVSIEDKRSGLEEAELIESIASEAPWQNDMSFLELCQVPYGFAVAKGHPLEQSPCIDPETLAGQTIAVIRQSPADPAYAACQELERIGANLLYYEAFSPSIIWDCSYYRRMLMVPVVWSDILFDVTVKPCRWTYSVPYGIFCRHELSEPAKEFLEFIRQTYQDGEKQIIPVFG